MESGSSGLKTSGGSTYVSINRTRPTVTKLDGGKLFYKISYKVSKDASHLGQLTSKESLS